MKTAFFASVCLIWAALANPAHAESLDDLLAKLKNHPQVDAILAESERQNELAKGQLGLPDPTVSLGINNMPLDNFSFRTERMTSKVVEFRQAIPSYSLRKAQYGIRQAESDKQKLMAEYAVAQLRALLIKRLVELNMLDELEDNATQQIALYKTIDKHLEGRTQAGDSVYGDFFAFDAQRLEVDHVLNDLNQERAEATEELRWLVGSVPEDITLEHGISQWPVDADKLYPALIAKEDVAIKRSGVEEADAAFGPNYGVETAYMQRDNVGGVDLSDTFTIKASISIPLWAESNQKPKLRAAQAAKRSAEFTFEDTKRQWLSRMNVLQNELDVLLKNVAVLEKKKAALDQLIAARERQYESGESDYPAFLKAKIDRLALTQRLIRHHAHHKMLIAQINSHIAGGEHEKN
ncbi:MAG: TolC family protein [Alphaproteobacteria bacterium]|nr:TolC family protein [Alphaproteobacteria bacterium]